MTTTTTKKADELIEKALGLDPASSEDEFVGYLNESIELNPYNFKPHVLLGSFYFKKEKFEAAAEAFLNALNIDYTFKDDPNEAAKVYLNLGKIYQTLGDKAKSLVYYKDYIGLFPSAQHSAKLAAQIYVKLKNFKEWFENYKQAIELLAAGKNKDAEKLFKSCIKANASFPWASYFLARSYISRGSYASVADILKKAIKHREHYCFKYELYRFQTLNNQNPDARLLNEVRKDAPYFVPAMILEAKKLKASGDIEQATVLCKQVISSLPGTESADEALSCLFDMNPSDSDDSENYTSSASVEEAASEPVAEEKAVEPEKADEPSESSSEDLPKKQGLLSVSASAESKAEAKGRFLSAGGGLVKTEKPAKTKQKKGLLHKTSDSTAESDEEAASSSSEELKNTAASNVDEELLSSFDSEDESRMISEEQENGILDTAAPVSELEKVDEAADSDTNNKESSETEKAEDENAESEKTEIQKDTADAESSVMAEEEKKQDSDKTDVEEAKAEDKKLEKSEEDSDDFDKDKIVDEAFEEAEKITEEAYAEAEVIKKAALDEAEEIRKNAENSLVEEKAALMAEREKFESEREAMLKEIEELKAKAEKEAEDIRKKAEEEAEDVKRESQVSAQILRKKIEIEERYEELLLKLNRERKALRLKSLDDAAKIIRAAEKKRDEIIARAEKVAEKIAKVSKQADDDYAAVYKTAIDDSYHMIADIRANAEKEGKHIIELAKDEKLEILQSANDKAFELLNKGVDMTFDATDDSLNRMVMDYGSIADSTRQKLDEFCSEMQESFEKMFRQNIIEIKNKFISSLDTAIEENGEEMRTFAASLKKELASSDISGIFSEAEGLGEHPVNLLKDVADEADMTKELSGKLEEGHGVEFPETSNLTDGIYPEDDTNPLDAFKEPSEEEEAAEVKEKVSAFVGEAFEGIDDIDIPEDDIEEDEDDIELPEDEESEAEINGDSEAEDEASIDEASDSENKAEDSDDEISDFDEDDVVFEENTDAPIEENIFSRFMEDDDED